jgi:hypothetical protein
MSEADKCVRCGGLKAYCAADDCPQQLAADAPANAEELREALCHALRQWKMYAEMEPDRDLRSEASTEAQMYREAVAISEAR